LSNLYLKNRVPTGSKLELSIVGVDAAADSAFVGSARLLLDDGSEEVWDDADIHPGPKRKKLVSPNSYVWRVRVAFTGPQVRTAVIRAHIEKPNNGGIFGEPYEFEVEGKNGDIARATIMAVTEK
jgi:hypothetical protein